MLSKKGYRIPNTAENEKRIKKELTVKPFQIKDYNFNQKSWPIYRKTEKFIYVPVHWGYVNFGAPESDFKKPVEYDIFFTTGLREYQVEIADKLLTNVKEKRGGIVKLTTGFGKTVLALWLIAKLKMKTLIVVHKENLKEQWQDRIQQFTNITDPGVIQGKKMETDSPICVGMLQSICLKDYPAAVFEEFDIVIFDEVHHLSSEVFSRAIFKTSSYYMLGLSATPKRTDNLEKVFHWALGPIIVESQKSNEQKATFVYVETEHEQRLVDSISKCMQSPRIICRETLRQHREKNGNHSGLRFYNALGNPNIPGMITTISKDSVRNAIILDYIRNIYKEAERYILVVSERIDHCKFLKKTLCEEGLDAGLYIGGMKNKELEKSNKCKLIIASRKMVEEGYDNPKLNTLLLTTSWSNIEQCTGRILRKKHKIKPIVVDFTDKLKGPFGVFIAQNRKRRAFADRHRKSSSGSGPSSLTPEAEKLSTFMIKST